MKGDGGARGIVRTYEEFGGHFALTWALLAVINLGTQAIFFWEMAGPAMPARAPGEYGIFNATLGMLGLLTLPAAALPVALRLFFARAQSTSLDRLRESSATVIETFTWVWAGCCLVLVLLPLPMPSLPRFSLDVFKTMNLLLMLGTVVSGAVCAERRQGRLWALLLVSAALARLAAGGWIMAYQPGAEAALAAFVVGGFVTLAPALHPREVTLAARLQACSAMLDASFLRFAAATFSVLLGIYLFTNADRIVTLGWAKVHVGEATLPSTAAQHVLDVYQATGLLARGLLWGTQPLLWILYAARSKLDKTTVGSLTFFWIYLGVLVAGAFALGALTHYGALSGVLGPVAGAIGPTLAVVMIPLGLLQGLGMFALASRRFPECYLIGGCGLFYALVLELVGSHSETMPPNLLGAAILPYMFGAAMVSLMIVLFVGVVRWGRKQP
jgi:hypothetical protein